MQAVVAVTPGHVLNIIVGGAGTDDGAGGYNGGGNDYSFDSFWPGAGGGGATTIIDGTTGETLIVVGGGGGGGGNGAGYDNGGGGGGTVAANGASDACGVGGLGGSSTAGGSGEYCFGDIGSDGYSGTGGDADPSIGSGGGGGGYYGGGGGAEGGGGGGGSSYTNALYASSVFHTMGYNTTTDGVATLTPLFPCSGTVLGGSAVSSTSAGDALTSFTLSLSGATVATGITYQWQSSSDGITYTNISGATDASYSFTGITANIYFQCIVTCTASASSATSSSLVLLYMILPSCTPTSSSWDGESFSVSYGADAFSVTGYGGSTLSDASITFLADGTTGYLDNTALTPLVLQQGGTYASSITWGTASSEQLVQVWIDFNDNGTFEPSEEVTPVSGYDPGSTPQPTLFNISVPVSAPIGTHLMRMRSAWETFYSDLGVAPSDMDPCLIEYGFSYPRYYSGDAVDYEVTIVALPPCTGTPDAGTATTSLASVCPSGSFTLNYTGALAAGLTYQWQSSPDGITWTDILGAVSVPYTTTESATTNYRVVVTCPSSSLSATSAPVNVVQLAYCYCVPTYGYGSPATFDALDYFSLTGYSGSTISDYGPTSIPSSGYEDESATISIDLQQGQTYSGSVTFNTYYNQFEDQVWIDFNDNGTFELSEEVTPVFGILGCGAEGASASFTLNIPLTATPGLHRMRIRQAETYDCTPETDMDPCNTYSTYSFDEYYYGCTRDYTANIIVLPPCAGTITAGTAVVTPSVGGAGTLFTLSLSSATVASGITYDWQSSPNGITWTDMPGGTTPAFSFTGIDSNMYFRCIETCTASSSTVTSVSVMATYALTPACYATSSSWSSEEYNVIYGGDAFFVNGFGGTSINDAGMTSSADPLTGYLDHTAMTPIQFQQNGIYASSLTWGISSTYQCLQVWIDFNNDGTFETSEEVSPVSGYPASQPTAFNITIPIGADTGMHLMRIRPIWESYFTDLGVAPAHLDPCLIEYGGSDPIYYSGDVVDYLVQIVPLPPCTGTPVAGSATSTSTSLCPFGTFDLNYSGVAAAGLIYQWQSSPDSMAWSDMVGATTVPYTTTESATTFYRLIITCSASTLSDTSAGVKVIQLPFCYCIPTYGNGDPAAFDALSNFSLTGYGGSTINDDGPTTPPYSGYEDESATTTIDLQQGQSYPGSVTYNTYYEQFDDQVWIDFNDNGTFEMSEEVTPVFGILGCSVEGISATFSLTIPITAPTGLHRMRVRQAETYDCTPETDMDPCNTYSSYSFDEYYYGVTRDYTANIIALPVCTGTPVAGSVWATDTTGCMAYSSVLTDTGYALASGLSYQWQSSSDGITWLNIGGATATVYNAAVSATTYFRLGVICGASGLTGYSTPITLWITPNPGPITMSSGGTPGGPFALCFTTAGVSFAGAVAGGVWSNAPASFGTVDASTGLWTPTGATGTTTISYTIASCSATASLNINSDPPSTPVLATGSNPMCAYSVASLTDAIPGGVWTTGSTAIATVDGMGNVTGTGVGNTIITYDDGCGTATYPVTVNGTGITLAPASGQICYGSTVDLTATLLTDPGVSYSWSGPAGTSGTTALTISSAVVSDAGIYTFTATTSPAAGSCVETVTLPVAIMPVPMITITPPSVSSCSGSGVPVVATSTLMPSAITILAQNFNTGMTGQVGGVWSVVNTGDASSDNWSIVSPYAWFDLTVPGDGTNFIGANADDAGFSTTLNTYLYSPVFSTVGYTSASLSFNHYIHSSTFYDYNAEIDYSTDGGVTWNVLQDYLGMTDGSTTWGAATPTHILTLPSGALGQPNVQLVWHYYSSFGFQWAVDNIEVDGAASPVSYSWTGVGGATGLSCTACSSPTITPGATGLNIYSVVATSGICSSGLSDSITVYPSPAPLTGIASVCLGSTSTLGETVTGGTWSIADPTVATVDASGVLTGVATGTTTVSYTIGVCSATLVVNVGTSGPSVISGISSICAGTTTTLHDSVSGGTWTSSAPVVATVDPTSGIVSGLIGGSTVISYTTGCGSAATLTVSVTPGPSSIAGIFSECTSSSVTLTDASAGGTWSSSNTAVAVAGSGSGIVFGVSAGVVNISYTQGCGSAIQSFTVNGTPATISGSASVCVAGGTLLTDATSGGTWSSATTSVATINSLGVVSGVSTGTSMITYTSACGMTTTTVTVNPSPAPIAGSASLCVGGVTTLTESVSGGTWGSLDITTASVDLSGVVSGMAPGITTISYTTSCGTASVTVTVNSALPAAITGGGLFCQGTTLTLGDVTPGGTWISGTPALATVSSSGVVSGTGGGMIDISYSTGCGTPAIATITVNPLPSVITGTTGFCAGSSVTLSDSVSGGAWSSTATAVAMVDPVSGIVSGIGAGTSIISYTNSCGNATMNITVNTGAPSVIVGLGNVCVGSTITLADVVSGGNWTSGSIGTATAGSATGVITGVATGTAAITYSTGCGSPVVRNITVNPTPAPITGTTSICATGSSTLSETASGGTWSSGSTSVATITPTTGIMSGVAAGTTTITYTTATCGNTTVPVTVIGAPPAISGSATLCVAGTSILSDAILGGTWSSSATSVVTVNAALGIAAGISTGTATITYTTACGMATLPVTVTGAPAAITGTHQLCIGTVATLSDATAGGTWLSGASSFVSVGSSTGAVSGVATGVAVITYSNGCGVATSIVSVNSSIVITSPATVCVSGAVTATDASSGGTWTSSDFSIATIGSTTGIVGGLAAGVVTLTYNSGGVCGSATAPITVLGVPASISGASSLCIGTSAVLTNTTTGGAWSSSSTGVITVNPLTGTIGGISPGASVITYSTGCGTDATSLVKVLDNPTAISGTSSVCVTGSTTLSESALDGTWSSGSPTLASISGTPDAGVVSGLAPGVVTITYSNGCGTASTFSMTVVGPPAAIAGPNVLYPGCTITLTDATTGGAWTSGSTSIGTVVSGSGVVTAVATGTTMITYATTCGIATTTVSVNGTPPAIQGTNIICAGTTTTLTDSSAGGSWSSGTGSITSVGSSSGVVTGLSAGVGIITYNNGCGVHLTYPVTVNLSPSAIGGFASLCQFSADTLTNTVSGGTWSGSDASIATIDPTSGVLIGVGFGTVAVTYMLDDNCSVTHNYTVNIYPNAGLISGPDSVCIGANVTLTDTSDGGAGTWSSGSPSVITTAGSVITSVGLGSAVINYTVTNGCGSAFAHYTVGVRPLPDPGIITGTADFCAGTATTLSDLTAGGTWSLVGGVIATIGTDGTVSGITPGVDTAVYTVTNVCGPNSAKLPIIVLTTPTAITGTTSVCNGHFTALTDTAIGGIWHSSDFGTATIDSMTGVATGTGVGAVTISYTGCGVTVTTTLTVNALPFAGTISGAGMVCSGSAITLSSTASGGSWTSGNTSVAAADSATGLVSGISAGVDTIIYSVNSAACGSAFALAIITVNPLPDAGILTGTDSVCVGSMVTIMPSATGGAWMISNAMATDTLGVVTGVTAGWDTLTYAVSSVFCGNASVMMAINVLPLPIAGSITGSASTVCLGAPLTLADATTGGVWMNGNSLVDGVSGGVVTGIATGIDTIRYAVTNSCGTAYASWPIAVMTLPDQGAITAPDSICDLTTTTLSNTVTGGTWISANGTVATISTAGVLSTTAAGFDTVYYSVTNVCGTDSAMKAITILPHPDSNTIATTTACVGAVFTLVDTALGLSGTWTSSNPTVATISLNVATAMAQGVDTIHYVVTSMCGVSLGTAILTVDSFPVIQPITGVSFVCLGSRDHMDTLSTTTAGGSWTSSNPLNPITSAGVLIGNVAGMDTVNYTVNNGGCFSDSFKVITVLTKEQCDSVLDVKSVMVKDGLIRVFPNPNTGSFTVSLPETGVDATIMVMDIYGKVLERRDVLAHTISEVQFDMNNLARGTYMIKVDQGDHTYRGKVLVIE